MNSRSTLFVAALAGVALASSGVLAATINYSLDLSVPGTFRVLATDIGADNVGISFYSVPLTGNVTSFDQRSPYAVSSSNFSPAGFSFLRTPDAAAGGVNPTILAGQDSTSGNIANFLYGIGQQVGSFATAGVTPFPGSGDTTSDIAWLNPIVLATGTYTGTLSINKQSVDLVGNVFSAQGSRETPAATITVGGVPEPATLTLFGLAMVGGLGFVRRRAA